jgi:hypothetical protein
VIVKRCNNQIVTSSEKPDLFHYLKIIEACQGTGKRAQFLNLATVVQGMLELNTRYHSRNLTQDNV